MRTIQLTLTLFGVLLFASCSKDSCKEQVEEDCICTMIYDPVCGCNDQTYGSPCVAECSGISDYTKGECK